MGNRYLNFIGLILVGLFTVSCGYTSFDSAEELHAYLKDPDNGYYMSKNVNGVEYSLSYRPTDLLVEQELTKDYSQEDVVKLRKRYEDQLYFVLSMSANGQEILNVNVTNRLAFASKVNQLAFGMEEKIHLITPKRDTLPMLDYVYPRKYGMSSNTNLLLVYGNKKVHGNHLKLVVEDMGYGTGEVAFNIDIEKLINQPKLSSLK